MPYIWNQVKINIPGVGERAYVLSSHLEVNGVCTLHSATLRQCMYIEPVHWDVGGPFEGVFPAVGEWLTLKLHQSLGPGGINGEAFYSQCYEVINIIDESAFLNGSCTLCPPTSDCGSNCLYNQNNMAAGGGLGWGGLGAWPFNQVPQFPFNNILGFTAGTAANCSTCTSGIPAPPTTGGGLASSDCCGPHGVLFAGRHTEILIPTNVGGGGGWVLPDNNVIPILPDDIGLPFCGFRGLNEPVSNGNLIVSPIHLWDDPQGWNQSTTLPSLTNYVDVHSFTQYISKHFAYYDKLSNQPLASFVDGIMVVPITGHTSLTSISPQPGGQGNTIPTYQEDPRGTGCPCSGDPQTAIISQDCMTVGNLPSNFQHTYDPTFSNNPPTYANPNWDIWLTANTTTPPATILFDGGAFPNWLPTYSSFVGCPIPGTLVGNPTPNSLCQAPHLEIMNFGKKAITTYYAPDAGYPIAQYPGSMVTTIAFGGGTKQPWQSGYATWEFKIGWLNNVSTQEGWLPPYMGLPFTTAMNLTQVNKMMRDIMADQVDIGNIVQSDWSSYVSYSNTICQWPCNLTATTQVDNGWFDYCKCTEGVSPNAPTTDIMLLGGFELTEKYITHPTISNYGTRTTNVLASGSWDNIRNFLYSCGMPNSIMEYVDARPWFEDNANSAAMGLQTVVNPLAFPDNAPNRVNIFNDVYVVNKSLNTRCPWITTGGVVGCTDNTATNYNSLATLNCDGSALGSIQPGWNSCCNYVAQGCGSAVCWDCDPSSYTCFVSSTGPYSSLQQCATACTQCECIKVIGTGHTGAYHWTHQTDCEDECCDGPSLKVCDVLIVGDDEGVLHYDVSTNITTHLFSDNSYDQYDIAVSFDKLWIYRHCFVAGTMVETAVGQTPIEKVKIGDIVKTYNTETNKVETSTVTETFIHPDNSNRLIINNKINTTPEHPFYIGGEWVQAGNLKVGDELHHLDGTKHKITSIDGDTTNQTVYNFEVEGTHNYFVEGYLVHNKQNQTDIKEFDITLSPFTLSYNRMITVPNAYIGKGLTFHSTNKLVCANTNVQTVDISTNVGTLTTLFPIPGGMKCTGDLLYTGTAGGGGNGMYIILYWDDDIPLHKVGKFTDSGQLIQESIIPNTIVTGTTYFDSLFTDTDTNKVYGITNDARVYELLQNPLLEFAPLPVHTTPIPFPIGTTKSVHGADNVQWPANTATEMSCSSGITAPISYNCQINPQLGIAGCIDPGNGTGTYTGLTALADCQNQSPTANPPGCIISWSCDPGTPAGNCQNVIHFLSWPGVYDKLSALNYIANAQNNLQYTTLDQISFESGAYTPQPGQCFVSSNGGSHPQWRIDYFTCAAVSPQNMYHWAYFINQCTNLGINVSLSDTLAWVIIKIRNHFNLPAGASVFKIYQVPCICNAQPCDCYPVLGSAGQYPTEAQCDAICCPPQPCTKCCINKFGNQIQMSPNSNPCKCPFGWVEIPCGGPCAPNVSCNLGFHWSYTACKCVCDQQPCPWGWHWDEHNCNCSPNNVIMAKKVDEIDPKSIDWTLSRGDLNIEASAVTTTNTLFTRPKVDGPTVKGPTKGEPKPTSGLFRTNSDGGCIECEPNQSSDYYAANNCVYTSSRCTTDSYVTYYVCSKSTNPVVGESQQACIPQDTKPRGVYYNTLESCLNSGCAGFMWCEMGQTVNGVRFSESEGEAYSPIPMCCVSVIESTQQGDVEYMYTSSGPLTVDSCLKHCGKGEIWYPLYNAFGSNTHLDSPLAYLTRELLLQVNIGQCTVEREESRFRELGYIRKNPYK